MTRYRYSEAKQKRRGNPPLFYSFISPVLLKTYVGTEADYALFSIDRVEHALAMVDLIVSKLESDCRAVLELHSDAPSICVVYACGVGLEVRIAEECSPLIVPLLSGLHKEEL